MMIILAIPFGVLCLLIAFVCYRAKCLKQTLVFSLLGVSALGAAALMLFGSHWLLQNL